MTVAEKTTRCTLCSRTVSDPTYIRGLGPVGPSCKEKVAGLERSYKKWRLRHRLLQAKAADVAEDYRRMR